MQLSPFTVARLLLPVGATGSTILGNALYDVLGDRYQEETACLTDPEARKIWESIELQGNQGPTPDALSELVGVPPVSRAEHNESIKAAECAAQKMFELCGVVGWDY